MTLFRTHLCDYYVIKLCSILELVCNIFSQNFFEIMVLHDGMILSQHTAHRTTQSCYILQLVLYIKTTSCMLMHVNLCLTPSFRDKYKSYIDFHEVDVSQPTDSIIVVQLLLWHACSLCQSSLQNRMNLMLE